MAKKPSSSVSLDFAFFNFLWLFYNENRGKIRQNYRDLTKKFLDYNDPSKRQNAFLRRPQFEALEIYVFLKEYLKNAKVEEIFQDWYHSSNKFENRSSAGFQLNSAQGDLLADSLQLEVENYNKVLKLMKDFSRDYPNYIFALTMGTGKTLLMATCVFYEFLLSNKFPKDNLYCKNALILAPDKTVLQSLREMESFDMSKVLPTEYVHILDSNIKFHFLEEAGTNLSTIDGSHFNIVVSNGQKIILKRSHQEKKPSLQLFEDKKPDFGGFADLYGDLTAPTNEDELKSNQRFEKLSRLPNLGIYVDEAHHAFGTELKNDILGGKDTSLRTTIDELSKRLKEAGTQVVACFNYTGTPYIGKDILPEVVYAFNLRDAINEKYLKQPDLNSYTITKGEDFVGIVVKDFLDATEGLRPEGMLPKIAFFATSIDELEKELKPQIEKELVKYNIPLDRILVNVGDDKLTKSDDIREFNNLDTPRSNKQFILLVNKGREGWNCRSLFGVAMYRSPKSKIFVLQATMRCLRSIGDIQHTGHIYLSQENYEILDKELETNFRMTASEFKKKPVNDEPKLQVKVREQVQIPLKHVKRTVKLKEKAFKEGTALGLDPKNENAWQDLTKDYRIIQTITTLDDKSTIRQNQVKYKDRTNEKKKRQYSNMMLVAEVARYLNFSPLATEKILESTKEGLDNITACVNEFNELLYDVVIPRLFSEKYDLESEIITTERMVNLIIPPSVGELSFYEIHEGKGGTSRYDTADKNYRDKSFNLDTYTFDSKPEYSLFWSLIKEQAVEKIYFTGMFTDKSKTQFYFQYIDPESYALRDYYPDFLVKLKDGSYLIIEVKADFQFEDSIVVAKSKAAKEYASESNIEYKMIKGTDAAAGLYHYLLKHQI